MIYGADTGVARGAAGEGFVLVAGAGGGRGGRGSSGCLHVRLHRAGPGAGCLSGALCPEASEAGQWPPAAEAGTT